MTYNHKAYGKLLTHTLPGAITDDREYKRIETIFNGLIGKGENNFSPEEDRLFDLLADLMENYERRTLPPLEPVSPADALRFIMEQNDLRQTDLEDVFGSQGVVSKVLNGKREISKAQAKRLAERFHLSVDTFI
jgi:HTH-type transcriptional regulator/antitoxin HigA